MASVLQDSERPSSPDVSVLIVAGEASGDLHGAAMLGELKTLRPDISTFGIGGNALAECGTELLFHASQTNVTGFAEVVRNYPFFRKVFRTIVSEVRRRRPAFAVLVDYPGFNLRLAKVLHQEGIPVFYYIAPQLWAWKEGRVKTLQSTVRALTVLFPFEVEYFARHGVPARFFGHPLVNRLQSEREDRMDRAVRLRGNDPRKIIAWLPGSRPNEIRRHLPIIVKAIDALGSDYRHVIARAMTVDPEYLSTFLQSIAGSLTGVEIHDDSSVVLQAADVAVVKSGTSTLQAGLIGTPFCLMYKTSTLSYVIAKRLARISSLGMVNILAKKEIVREFIQSACTPETLTAEVHDLLHNTERTATMTKEFSDIQTQLFEEDSYLRTARFVAEKFL